MSAPDDPAAQVRSGSPRGDRAVVAEAVGEVVAEAVAGGVHPGMPPQHRPNVGRRWTPQDDARLRDLVLAALRPGLIAITLGRTRIGVERRARLLGLALSASGRRCAAGPLQLLGLGTPRLA